MMVKRISATSLEKLLQGDTTEAATCVIKIYGNHCNYCHNLKDYYEQIASRYEEVYFYAFNIEDDLLLEERLGFNGIPTILKIVTEPPNATGDILSDPESPNKLTWFQASDITQFIEEKNEV